MARLQVETTQNVLLDFDLAGAGDRIVASIIDLMIALFYMIVMAITLDSANVDLVWTDGVSVLVHIVLYFPFFFYHLYMEYFLNGQTPGKRMMKIKVMKTDGASPSFGDYLLRWMLRVPDSLPLFGIVGIICIAATKKEQRLGDMAANTAVVRTRKRAALEDTVLKIVKNNAYQPIFTNVLLFSDKDINLIKETVDYCKKTGDLERVVKLAKKVRELNPDVPHMPPLKMLETLIYDYNFIAQKVKA